MRKPDRFERMGERVTNRYIGTYIGGPEHAKEIATLLRREHAWMRRVVKNLFTATGKVEYEIMLIELDKRKR